MEHAVKMGTLLPSFNDGDYQDITFCVTEECNLRCKYCYMYHKNNFNRMSVETAKKAVDFILAQEPKFPAAVWGFIGGEPTLEIDLIDEVTDYIKMRMYELNHPWFNHHAFFVDTNGLLYESPKVQRYIVKNKGRVQFAITIDGTKEKHDLQRVKKDGSGSYDDVVRNLKLWMTQETIPKSTKATFSSGDIPLLKDSIINLWDLGLEYVAANVVFEDVWKEGDDLVYEDQLKQLADYIIENELWDTCSVRFFEPTLGFQMSKFDKTRHFCGTGTMIAVSTEGKLYPCIRFLDFCMGSNAAGYCIGDIEHGYDIQKKSAFEKLSIERVNEAQCNACTVASGCFSCTGNNYDDMNGKTLFHRAVYNCKMHKAQARANKYFWKRYSEKTGKVSPFQVNRFEQFCQNGWRLDNLDFLYMLESDDTIPYCNYTPSGEWVMDPKTFKAGLEYVEQHDMVPVVVTNHPQQYQERLKNVVHIMMFPAECGYERKSEVELNIPIYTCGTSVVEKTVAGAVSCIINVEETYIGSLADMVEQLHKWYTRVNINKLHFEQWGEEALHQYEEEIQKIGRIMGGSGLNLIDESMNHNCEVGMKNYLLAPNGRIYACPAFYYAGKEEENEEVHVIGSLQDGIAERPKAAYNLKHSATCDECKNKHCAACLYVNYRETGDALVCAKKQCKITELESEKLKEAVG